MVSSVDQLTDDSLRLIHHMTIIEMNELNVSMLNVHDIHVEINMRSMHRMSKSMHLCHLCQLRDYTQTNIKYERQHSTNMCFLVIVIIFPFYLLSQSHTLRIVICEAFIRSFIQVCSHA